MLRAALTFRDGLRLTATTLHLPTKLWVQPTITFAPNSVLAPYLQPLMSASRAVQLIAGTPPPPLPPPPSNFSPLAILV